MGLFSSSKSSSASNVTTTTNTSYNMSRNYRDYGFTGAQATQLGSIVTGAGVNVAAIGSHQNQELGKNTVLFADKALDFLKAAQGNVFQQQADLSARSRGIDQTAGKAASDIVTAAQAVANPSADMTKMALYAAVGIVGLFVFSRGF